MLAEAKDTSEIMVDLAYAAVYFNDPGMADEVAELEERMNDLVQDMRAVCIMAVRRPAEAEGMASVLPGFYSATSINFLELRFLETDSATEDAASLTFETVSSLRESATLWTVGARICAAGAKAPRTDSKPAEEGEEASSATEEEEKS